MSDQTVPTTSVPADSSIPQVVVVDEATAQTVARFVRAKSASKKFFKVVGTTVLAGAAGGLVVAASCKSKTDEDEYVPQSYDDTTAPTE